MKRQRLMQYLRENHCGSVQEGGDHTWVINLLTGQKSFVPRRLEIKSGLVWRICL
jgi:hypothetical protein